MFFPPLPQLKIEVDKTLYLTHDLTHFHPQIFHKRMPPEAVDLVSRLLQYSPNLRCTAVSNTVVHDLWFCILRLSKSICSLTVSTSNLPLFLYVFVNESIDNYGIDMTSVRILLIISCCVGLYFVMQLEALVHPFFDELRDPNVRLPNGRFVPPLFNFKPHGELFFDGIQFSFYIWCAVIEFYLISSTGLL